MIVIVVVIGTCTVVQDYCKRGPLHYGARLVAQRAMVGACTAVQGQVSRGVCSSALCTVVQDHNGSLASACAIAQDPLPLKKNGYFVFALWCWPLRSCAGPIRDEKNGSSALCTVVQGQHLPLFH
jgi:hypothetical protein